MRLFIPTLLSIVIWSSCGRMKTPDNAIVKFEEFKRTEKFLPMDLPNFYPGLSLESLRPILTEKIHLAADDFQRVASGTSPTEAKYLEAIDTGLARFEDIYMDLDTEDRERVCSYFQELMDIVELESSGGRLNAFMYGFDPKEKR
jgi:hypothetical protein